MIGIGLFTFIIYLFITINRPFDIQKTDITAGEVNLETVDFKQTLLSLNGEWSFYPNKLLNPNGIGQEDSEHFLQVPKIWNS
jgi:hypothetical protein